VNQGVTVFDMHGVQRLAMSVIFDGQLLLLYVKSDCYGNYELLNARLLASIVDKYSKLSRFDPGTIHTQVINLTVQ